MMVIEQFHALIGQQDEDELIAFLRALTDSERKSLSPSVKKLSKEYSQYGTLENGRFGHTNGTDAQRNLLQFASFVCLNLADYEKSAFSIWMLNREQLVKMIDWYCPAWFNDFVNKQASLDFVPDYLHYDWLMELAQRGLLHPSRELLVRVMPRMVFEQDKNRKWALKPGNLLKTEITLKEHIWYLFEFESNLHLSDRYMRLDDTIPKDKTAWLFLFRQYAEERLLDRSRLLRESLLASNRNFNMALSGWFAQLFVDLAPAKEEILSLQKELFSVLGSPGGKPVKISLQMIKSIAPEKEFDVGGFLDAVPVLLSSGVKATLLASLMILEKLIRQHPAHTQRIVLTACRSFIQADEEVQLRAAKLIERSGEVTDPALRLEIAAFYPGILTTPRQLLTRFHDADSAPEQVEVMEELAPAPAISLAGLTEITVPASIDDLVFLASQAFDNNEPWHVDVLPAALVQFLPQLKAKDIPLFEPTFQRAFGLIKSNFHSTAGHLDNLLATFFIDFGNWLIRHFPAGSESIVRIYKTHDTDRDGKRTSFLVSPASGSYSALWAPYSKIIFYQPYKELLLAALDRINRRSDLFFLSTPTHAPCWISPGILIDRLHYYQQAGLEPDEMDLQVAISRVLLLDQEACLEQARRQLSGEFRALMLFLLDDGTTPQKPFHHKAAWMVASLTRKEKTTWPAFASFSYHKLSLKNYTGQLEWESVIESYTTNRYDHALYKKVEERATRKTVSVKREYTPGERSGLKKIFSGLLPMAKVDPPMLYEFMNYRPQYLTVEYNDVKRILSLIPNNPEPILADTINKCLKYPDFPEEGAKRMVIAVEQFLYETWHDPGEMAYLFLGTCMLGSDRTVVNMAGEIWLKAVTTNSIDSAALGDVIGRHERIEFAPLKRFTDLANGNLFRVSARHNRGLQVLIEHILVRLPDAPIKNLKKLLEVYRELMAVSGSRVQLAGVGEKLKAWEGTGGLQKIAGALLGI